MKQQLAINITILLATVTMQLLYPAQIFAQNTDLANTQSGLSMTPSTVEILLAPNKNIIQTFTIKNQGKSAQFVASLHNFESKGTDGLGVVDPRRLDPSTLPIIASLQNADIELGQPFSVGAGETQQLVLKIEAANVDRTEDAYIALVVSTSGAGREIVATAGISSLIFVTVTPDGVLPLDISVEDFSLPYIADSMSTLTMGFNLKNKTAVLIRPEGTLTIVTPRGDHNQEMKLYPNLILGSSTRTGMIQSSDDPPMPVTPTWNPGKAAIGPHRVRLTITTPGGRKIQEVEKTIWVLPFKLIISIVTGTILFMISWTISRRKSPIDTTL